MNKHTMTFKEAVDLCSKRYDVIITECTIKKQWEELVKLVNSPNRPMWRYKENPKSNVFYYYPHSKNYGHFNYDELVAEGRTIYRFSTNKTKLLLDHVRRLDGH